MKNHHLASGALLVGFVAMLALCTMGPSGPKKAAVVPPVPPVTEPAERHSKEIYRQTKARIQLRLDAMAREVAKLLTEHVGVVDAFFAEAKNNTPHFAEEALGWASKWRLVRGYLPFGQGEGHQKYLREKFEEIVLSPQHLETLVRQTIHRYQARLQALENQLLVDLQADLQRAKRTGPC